MLNPKTEADITPEEMVQELARELAMRREFYRKQVEYGKMTREKANRQYLRLAAAKTFIENVLKNQPKQGDLFN